MLSVLSMKGDKCLYRAQDALATTQLANESWIRACRLAFRRESLPPQGYNHMSCAAHGFAANRRHQSKSPDPIVAIQSAPMSIAALVTSTSGSWLGNDLRCPRGSPT